MAVLKKTNSLKPTDAAANLYLRTDFLMSLSNQIKLQTIRALSTLELAYLIMCGIIFRKNKFSTARVVTGLRFLCAKLYVANQLLNGHFLFAIKRTIENYFT